MNILKSIFGSRNDRVLRRMRKVADRINALEPGIAALSDADLRANTDEFRNRLAQGETLDAVIELRVRDEALVARITGRSTCGKCGEVYHDETKPIPTDGKCTNCGASDFRRRADDNEESLKNRLMEYYKKTSPLLGYYYAKGLLRRVDGLADMVVVQASIGAHLDN